jgi:hypothetical protein
MNPTNDTILFQHLLSNSGCHEWITLTIPRTLKYCVAHKIDFRLVMGDIPPNEPGHWAVPQLILDYMDLGYKNVVYLDADCIVGDVNRDMRDACVPDKIGAVWHNLSYLTPDWSCYNVGALYVSSSPKVRGFVSEWLAKRPGSSEWPWWENGEFNILGKKMDIINCLDNSWNAGHVSPSDHPVVMGLHGLPDRLESIKKRMQELDGK